MDDSSYSLDTTDSSMLGMFITIYIPNLMPHIHQDIEGLFGRAAIDNMHEYIAWIVNNAVMYVSTNVIASPGLNGDNLSPAHKEYVQQMVVQCGERMRFILNKHTGYTKYMAYVYRQQGDFYTVHCIEET